MNTLLVKSCNTITYCFKRCCRWIQQKYSAVNELIIITMGANELFYTI